MRFASIQIKAEMFLDDPFTFISSTPNNLTPEGKVAKINFKTFRFKKHKNYTGVEIKKSLFEMNPSFKSIIKDLKTIRTNNIERTQPTLYYSIFRIWGSGLDGLNAKELINRGAYLNLVFFTLSFFFLYKLLALIKNDKKFIALGLFFGSVCIASVSTSMLIRPYAMQETLFILVNYIVVILWKKIENSSKITNKETILYSIAFSLFLLSGYFSLIYTGIVFVFCIVTASLNKRWDMIKSFVLIAIMSTILTVLFYPSYFDFHSNNEHIGTVTSNIANLSFGKLREIFNFAKWQIGDYIVYPRILLPIIITISFSAVFWNKSIILAENKFEKNEVNILLCLLFLSIIWMFIILYTTPYLTYRYTSSVTFIISLLLTAIAFRLKKIILYVCLIFYFIISINPSFEYIPGMQVPFASNSIHEKFYALQKQGIPIVVTAPLEYWYNVNFYVIMDDNEKIQFIENPEEIKYLNMKRFMLFTTLDINYDKAFLLYEYCGLKLYLVDNSQN